MSYKRVPNEFATELRKLLQHRQLKPVYQPIVSLVDQQIIGYESLIRGSMDSPLYLPFVLFQTAIETGLLIELEQLCWDCAIKHFQTLELPGKLFINISASSLLYPTFQAKSLATLFAHYDFSPDQLVLEVNEDYHLHQLPNLNQVIHAYRLLGCQIAVDDLGIGYSNLRLWAELHPHYVKTDSHFLKELPSNLKKKEFIHFFHDNCQLIAKGIEQESDYQEMVSLGLHLGQGNYFSPPQLNPPQKIPLELFSAPITEANEFKLPRSNTIACLIVEVPFVSPTALVEQVADIFHDHPEILSIPVVNQANAAIGIIRRHNFMDIFLSRYGRELHGRKPISSVMDTDQLIFDVNLSLEEVSLQLTTHFKLAPDHNFIICEQGNYRGVGNVLELLAKITELQIRNARYANPLTLLPGNVPIYEYIENLLQQHQLFTVGYCDLDNFKPFNDVYGYNKGDLVIQTVANILLAHTDTQQDFVGHIGGDDFIVVMQSEDWEQRFKAMLAEFERCVPTFYNETDRQRHGIITQDRAGKETFFPLLALSIGAIVPNLQECHSYHEIAAMATDAKHQAKQQPGNSLFIERRYHISKG